MPAVTRAAPKPAPAPAAARVPARTSADAAPAPRVSPAGGGPIPAPTRARLEASLGADLSGVRVHTGPAAAAAARGQRARAFAHGPNVVLGAGARADDVPLMAHEVAHVLQQQVGPPAAAAGMGAPRAVAKLGGLPAVVLPPIGAGRRPTLPKPRHQAAAVQPWTPSGGDRFEREANRAADAVARGESFDVTGRGAPGVQRLGISDALDYFADKAYNIPGYRMFTIILGVNPINMESVERSAANILRAVIEFLPGGHLITEALDKYGIVDKVAGWVEEQIATLGMTGRMFKDAVMDFLDSLGWRDIFHLGDVWDRAKRIFTDPIGKIIDFGTGLVTGIITFIKDAILMPIAKLAEGTRGWDLLIAVLGKNPVTGDKVERTAETLIPGFLKLIGQEEVWENMKKANALGRAWAWFQTTLSQLLGFVSAIPSMVIDAFKSLELTDLIVLPRAFVKVGTVFANFLGDFISWAGTAVWNLLEIIFDVVSPGAWGYVKKTGAALKSILKNPLPFVGNLVRAAKGGFNAFATNFGKHLKAGLIDWLTGSLQGIYVPRSFDFGEVVKFALSALGLSWANVRQKLVKVVGETTVRAMEVGFDLVVTLVKDGPAAAWAQLKTQLMNLKDQVVSGIIDMIVGLIVTKAVPKLIAMFIPGAGFISAIISIYETVMVFVNKIAKIIQVVKGFIDSIVTIAAGNIGSAVARVESVLAGLLALAINFLFGFAGLGKIADKLMGVLAKVRDPIDKALDWLVGWVVAAAQKLGKFVAQAGLPQDPAERLRLGMDAAEKVVNALSGNAVGEAAIATVLAAVKVRYGFQTLRPVNEGGDWWVEGTINPKSKKKTRKKKQVTAEGQAVADDLLGKNVERLKPDKVPEQYRIVTFEGLQEIDRSGKGPAGPILACERPGTIIHGPDLRRIDYDLIADYNKAIQAENRRRARLPSPGKSLTGAPLSLIGDLRQRMQSNRYAMAAGIRTQMRETMKILADPARRDSVEGVEVQMGGGTTADLVLSETVAGESVRVAVEVKNWTTFNPKLAARLDTQLSNYVQRADKPGNNFKVIRVLWLGPAAVKAQFQPIIDRYKRAAKAKGIDLQD